MSLRPLFSNTSLCNFFSTCEAYHSLKLLHRKLCLALRSIDCIQSVLLSGMLTWSTQLYVVIKYCTNVLSLLVIVLKTGWSEIGMNSLDPLSMNSIIKMVLHFIIFLPMIDSRFICHPLGRWTPEIKTTLSFALIYKLHFYVSNSFKITWPPLSMMTYLQH